MALVEPLTHPAPEAQEIKTPKTAPVLGVLPWLKKDPLNYFVSLAVDYGDIVPLKLGPAKAMVLNREDYIRHVAVDNMSNYRKSDFYEILRPILGDGIFMCHGPEWKKQRQTIQPAFRTCALKAMVDAMVAATEEMFERWEQRYGAGEAFDIAPEMMRVTLDILLRTMFGTRLPKSSESFYDTVATLLGHSERRMWTPFPLPLSVPTPANLSYRKALAAMEKEVEAIIDHRRRTREENDGEDLLTLLLDAYDGAGGGEKNLTLLRDQVMSILLAGHETTANGLVWVFKLLSEHPDKRELVRKTVFGAMGDGAPTQPFLMSHTYLTNFIEESMRLYPPVWNLSRTAIEDDRLGDTDIPAGTVIINCPYAMHRNPRYWENPEGFDPNRFEGGWTRNEQHRFRYMPFGAGPRSCAGERFAMLEATIVTAMALQRYDVDLVPGQVIRPAPMITLRPAGTVMMTMRRVHGPRAPLAAVA